MRRFIRSERHGGRGALRGAENVPHLDRSSRYYKNTFGTGFV